PRALGEVGDWLLENDKVRFIIQDQGFSRGFGVFGGALLDADLVRPEDGRGDSSGGIGRDNFGEMFPAFFLEALNPTQIVDPATGKLLPPIEIEHPGGDGKDAVLLVRAVGDDFLAITQNVNETALGDKRISPTFNFETRYILHPGAQYLEIDSKIINVSGGEVDLPKQLAGVDVPTPFGDVVLFGAGNKVFTPNQAGYDLRFHLQDIYATGGVGLPALPGLLQDFIASSSKDVSYGLMTFPPTCDQTDPDQCPSNFALANADQFAHCPQCGPPPTDHTIHVPFIASAFTGAFQVLPPKVIPNGGSFHARRAFIVGDGDIASISDQVYGLLGDKTGQLQGRVQERQRARYVEGAEIFVEDASGNKVTEIASHKDGFYDAKLRPGHYNLVVVVDGQGPSPPVGFDIKAGETHFEPLFVDSPAELIVTVVEKNVGPVPAKVTLVGTYDGVHDDTQPQRFLFDLSVDEPWRYTDLIPDDENDPSTRRYIEVFGTSPNGVVHLRAKPGTYDVVASRGPEYGRVEIKHVTLKPGEQQDLTAVIEREIDTTGYVSADFHLHTQYSLDSGAKIEDRITSYAAEGLEYAVSTDHNFVVDYQPIIAKLGLDKFMNSMVGIELTTIDRGHFQGYPLERQPGDLVENSITHNVDTIASRTYGSFEWALRTPDQVFTDLRKLGRSDGKGGVLPIIVQVNHPRDSILGYFDQYGVSPVDLAPSGVANALLKPDDCDPELDPGGCVQPGRHTEFNPKNFSFNFDAIEVMNGKRFDFLHTFRVPNVDTAQCGDVASASLPCVVVDGAPKLVNPGACCEVQANDIVLEPSSKKCRDGSKDCVCDEDTFKFQVEQNNCGTGDVAFPGVVEDWMNLLMTGTPDHHIVGTANSDSHEPTAEEPATPRTYVGVGKDEPFAVTPDDVVGACHRGDVLMTNGPFVRITATGDGASVGMGGTVHPKGGVVHLAIHVENALPTVEVDTVDVYVNAVKVKTATIDDGNTATKHDLALDVPATADGFLIVEVTGKKSEFPSIYPQEVPPLQFTDVIGALGSSFGLSSDAEKLKPVQVFVLSPDAITNPIWIDGDGDGVVTPLRTLPVAGAAQASTHKDRLQGPSVMKAIDIPWVATEDEAAQRQWETVPLRKRLALSRLPHWLWPSDDPRDIRRVLVQFIAHAN
ncbi:MAG TPA: hypothetical protein VGO62_17885, partial [Myxococcota bacterium]